MNLKTKKFNGLYVIIDPSFINSKDPVNIAQQVLDGGANIIQLRNKADNIRETVDWAIKISELCNSYNAFFIVNDRVDIAIISNSHGVHLGQGDISPDHVKNITDKDLIIGSSNATIKEIEESNKNSSDYIAVGSIYSTDTKSNTRPASLNLLVEAKKISNKPIVAIGGIKENNIEEVLETGVDSVCMVTAITLSKDPQKATERFSKFF
ncbi:MAG: thiamine phosphate synthase [Chloroflexi bacterium]|nr:thiamine phosphate synthase [Chloroflexota bacterium]|tara:strand:+ start:3807 stop:4433 length:627 start_codon:yes stop_codon:yes gene_type:complete